MSVLWNPEELFGKAKHALRRCDEVIEKLVDCDGMPTAQCPLDKREIESARELMGVIGIMLSLVFADHPEREKALTEFVFENATGFIEEILDEGNAAYIVIQDEEEEQLDRVHDWSDRVKRGIEWLDARDDIGTWEAAIYRGVLKMSDPCNCMGGSIFGEDDDPKEGPNGFTRLCELLKAENLSPIELGFESNKTPGDLQGLQNEWLEQVEKRR